MRRVVLALGLLLACGFVMAQSSMPVMGSTYKGSGGGSGSTFVSDAFGGGGGACFHTLTCTTTSFTPAIGDYLLFFSVTTATTSTITLETPSDTCNTGGTSDTFTVIDASALNQTATWVLAYAKVGANASCAAKITLVGPTNEQTIVYTQMVHNVAASAPIEGSGACTTTHGTGGGSLKCATQQQSTPGTGANAVSSGSAGTPTVSGSYIFSCSVNTGGASTYSAGTGFTLRSQGNDSFVDLSYGGESGAWTSGAVSGTFTDTAGASGIYVNGAMVVHP